jgi:hypothetical protein
MLLLQKTACIWLWMHTCCIDVGAVATGDLSMLLLLLLLQQGHFLLEDPQELAHELALKDEAMATKPHVVFAAEECSLPAQQVRRVTSGAVAC